MNKQESKVFGKILEIEGLRILTMVQLYELYARLNFPMEVIETADDLLELWVASEERPNYLVFKVVEIRNPANVYIQLVDAAIESDRINRIACNMKTFKELLSTIDRVMPIWGKGERPELEQILDDIVAANNITREDVEASMKSLWQVCEDECITCYSASLTYDVLHLGNTDSLKVVRIHQCGRWASGLRYRDGQAWLFSGLTYMDVKNILHGFGIGAHR